MDAKLRRVKKLQVRAARGDKEALSSLAKINDEVATEVNKRLRALERRGYAYGGYNRPTHFTEVMYDGNRFLKSAKLDNDFHLMATQTEIGIKFLNLKTSTVEGAIEVENKRINTLIDSGIIPEGTGIRKVRNFLKFLGNEEVSDVIDSFGTSDMMVEMLFDAYNRTHMGKNKMIARFREYLEGNKSLDEIMNSMGVNPLDYTPDRWIEY